MLKYWWFVRDQKWKSGVPDNAKEFLFKKKKCLIKNLHGVLLVFNCAFKPMIEVYG